MTNFRSASDVIAQLIRDKAELLEALANLLRDEKLDDDHPALIASREKAIAAIAKARGEA